MKPYPGMIRDLMPAVCANKVGRATSSKLHLSTRQLKSNMKPRCSRSPRRHAVLNSLIPPATAISCERVHSFIRCAEGPPPRGETVLTNYSGAQVIPSTPGELAARQQKELAIFRSVVAKSGMHVE